METKTFPLDYRSVILVIVLLTNSTLCTSINTVPADSSISQDVRSIRNLQDSSYYYYEPYPIKPGTSILQLGGSFTLLPLPVVENEYPAPAFDMQYKRGLWDKIAVDVSFSTNYFSNLFHAGLQWNFNINKFSLGIANHIGGFYGFINTAGQFDQNSAAAFFDLPIIRIGYRLKRYSISMSWAASYIFTSYNKVSGLKADGPQGKINDIFCTVAIEQPFLKKSLLSIGFSLNYARSPYQSWMLYNTLDQYLFLPEFFFSFQL
jgi:hypothetical protein